MLPWVRAEMFVFQTGLFVHREFIMREAATVWERSVGPLFPPHGPHFCTDLMFLLVELYCVHDHDFQSGCAIYSMPACMHV
jgi:hypothetical protein